MLHHYYRLSGHFKMRLTAVLAKWPKKMPRGNIWTGTNRMHPRLLGPNQARLMKKVEQEKKNLFYIMRPAVSFVSSTRIKWWKMLQGAFTYFYLVVPDEACLQGFFLDILKKTQAQKNSKLKLILMKTQAKFQKNSKTTNSTWALTI